MQTIHKLPQSEIDKICAGEVVDRPASVVKELVENSLDAGARSIEVVIEDGGKRLIKVSDNGAGIPSGEIELALSQHCTSKINLASDLQEKHTLGFRGEALYSISAVSKLSLVSRNRNEQIGIEARSEAAQLLSVNRIAHNPGTSVEVRELFFNTPVRRKFLRAKSTEISFITTMLLQYALAYTGIEWKFTSDGKELFSTSGDGDISKILPKVFDKDSSRETVCLDYEHNPDYRHISQDEPSINSLTLSGVVARPHHHRSTRIAQYFFVNRRPVRHRIFFKAVDDAFKEYLSPGKHPLCVLFLGIPPSDIDVNIHPSKQEVDFSDSGQIYALITIGLKRALSGAASQRQIELAKSFGLSGVPSPVRLDEITLKEPSEGLTKPIEFPEQGKSSRELRENSPQLAPYEPKKRSVPVYIETPPAPDEISGIGRAVSRTSDYSQEFDSGSNISAEGLDLSKAAVLGQIARTFIVFLLDDAVFLLDQHSAHERILFENIYRINVGKSATPPTQGLVFPILLSVRPDQAKAMAAFLPALSQLGFAAELFGEDTLLLREVPAAAAERMDVDVFRSMVEEFIVSGAQQSYNEMVKHAAATAACKCAIKAGDSLNQEEMTWLVKSLTTIEDSFSCPHGRPTVVRLGVKEIRRLFQR